MPEENASATVENVKPAVMPGGKRQRSSIAFPYMDLNEAITVASTIFSKVATGPCDTNQLAPWMNQSVSSSTFRLRITASRLFGLVNTERADALILTDLGQMTMDHKREREGRAKAFLSVPLFSAVFEKFKDRALPPAAALEKELVALGVAGTLADMARRVLERSAEQAGFFESGRDRLVMPGIKGGEDFIKPAAEGGGNGGGGGSGNGGDGNDHLKLDDLLMALLQKIPSKEEGWPEAKRIRWFRTFAMNVSQIYDTDDAIVELKIEATKD